VSFLNIWNLPYFQKDCWLIILVSKLQTQEHDMKERGLRKVIRYDSGQRLCAESATFQRKGYKIRGLVGTINVACLHSQVTKRVLLRLGGYQGYYTLQNGTSSYVAAKSVLAQSESRVLYSTALWTGKQKGYLFSQLVKWTKKIQWQFPLTVHPFFSLLKEHFGINSG
jgi:hypothetical protein